MLNHPIRQLSPRSLKLDNDSDSHQFVWFIKMQYAYKSEDSLSIAEKYYNKLKSSTGPFRLSLIEAEYLLSRFHCGIQSALSDLKALSGPRTDAYDANMVLGKYYQSIGERGVALRYLNDKYSHSPNMDSKLYAALALAELHTQTEKYELAVSFLTTQLSVFNSDEALASVWEKLGSVYDLQKMDWRKQICFEKSLTYNPDNTDLRFTLAYSYGESSYGQAMAAHPYKILRAQSPSNSTIFNNLSVIYDEIGAVTTKITLLREARSKKNAYVSANLSRTYAKAGFLADAITVLEDVPASD